MHDCLLVCLLVYLPVSVGASVCPLVFLLLAELIFLMNIFMS